MKDSNLSVALTVKVGSASLTIEMQKKESEKPDFRIEAKSEPQLLECKEKYAQ